MENYVVTMWDYRQMIAFMQISDKKDIHPISNLCDRERAGGPHWVNTLRSC